ncbi:MAG: AMP-binding protein [Chloroflexota bacterium]
MTLIRPDSRLTPEMIQDYCSTGAWRARSLGSYLREAVAAQPERQAAVGYDVHGDKLTALSYRDLADLVDRLAAGLLGLGVQPGDAVSAMLPNRVEFAALMFAIAEIGAVYSGIPAAYGQRESTFMVRRVKSKVLVVPDSYRNRNYVELARQIRSEAAELDHVIVLGDAPEQPGWLSFEELAAATPVRLPNVEPSSLVHVGFTSGTTGEPKGVMNTHQTLDAVLFRFIDHHGPDLLNQSVVNLIASPMGHHTGFLWGVLFTTLLGGRGVYLEHWDRDVAAKLIRDEGVTWMAGAPTFLQDLLMVPGMGPGSLKMYAMAGSPIPRSLPREASASLDAFICPAWGMTEWGIGICGSLQLPRERVDVTDGIAIPGCEARVMAAPMREADPGEEGDLQIRGGGLFLGYFDRPDFTEDAFVDGWFQTGDRAIKWEDGFISLSGRSKDIVIRGGENVPVVEIETLIYQHPAVLDVAVVGYPDERLGERACAIVAVRQGSSLDLPELIEFLLSKGMSKHFLPERLEHLAALPKTMSGKIKKAELRQWLMAGGDPPD